MATPFQALLVHFCLVGAGTMRLMEWEAVFWLLLFPDFENGVFVGGSTSGLQRWLRPACESWRGLQAMCGSHIALTPVPTADPLICTGHGQLANFNQSYTSLEIDGIYRAHLMATACVAARFIRVRAAPWSGRPASAPRCVARSFFDRARLRCELFSQLRRGGC
jgi:hypothetical protein